MVKKTKELDVQTVLFLCTGNSCRSIMAEALMNTLGKDQYRAFSAGSNPTGEVHPIALSTLKKNNINIDAPSSKSWDIFQDMEIDLVVTVCSNAAKESCPAGIGKTEKIGWAIADPAQASGTKEEVEAAFNTAFFILKENIENLIHIRKLKRI